MSTASTATSALSGLLSSLNNGSAGLDVTSAVNSVLYADRAPERAWQAKQTTLASQTSAIQQLESQSLNVATDLQSLGDATGVFSSVSATSSNSAAVSASAATGTTPGSHTVSVSALATTGSWYSAEQSSSSATLPSGSFTINQGSNSTTFSTGSGSSNGTLDQLAAAINASSSGVSASVVNDANGARLALVAQNSGTAADFTISSDTGLAMTQAVTAANASLTVDGAPVTSASNTVVNAISGLTLNLSAVTSTPASGSTPATNNPVTITIAPNSSSIQTAVSNFVTDYNTLIGTLNAQFTLNTTTGTEGTLAADSAARSMQSAVLAATNLTVGSSSGAISNLNSLGVTTNQNGTLSLNTATLQSALSSNYQGVVNFFQGSGSGSSAVTGYASQFVNTLNTYTDPAQGAFTVDLQSISNENQDLTNQTNNLELYLSQEQTVLTTEYNNANIALQQLPTTIKNTQVLLGDYSTGSSNG